MPFGFGKKNGRTSKFGGTDQGFESQLQFLESKAEAQEYQRLKERVEKLTQVCEALWGFIRKHHQLNEEDLIKSIEEIKSADEIRENCPTCGRIMNLNQNRCLYCGTQGTINSFFDTL
jgi:hypothetical protein